MRRLAFDVTFEAVSPARNVRALSLIAPCASSALFDALSNLVNPSDPEKGEGMSGEGRAGKRVAYNGQEVRKIENVR